MRVAHVIQGRKAQLVVMVFVMALGLLIVSGVASALQWNLVWNTIDEEATLFGNGQGAFVTGPVECTEGGRVAIRVEVTQGATTGTGSFRAPCTGEEQEWAVSVVVRGSGKFEPGPATATAWAVVGGRQHATDDSEWTEGIVLVAR